MRSLSLSGQMALLFGCMVAGLWSGVAHGSSRHITGSLETVWVDPEPGSDTLPRLLVNLAQDDGKVRELNLTEKQLASLGDYFSLRGTRVRLTLSEPDSQLDGPSIQSSGTKVTEISRVETDSSGSQTVTSATMATGTGVEIQNWVILLCKFADLVEEPFNQAFFQSMLGNEDAGLDRYWREVSGGKISLEGSIAYDWVQLPKPWADYGYSPSKQSDLFNDCTAAANAHVDFSNGTAEGVAGIIMVFNGSIGAYGYGGSQTGTLDGVTKSWPVVRISNSATTEALYAHEMGHAFGLPHADNGDGDNNPYDNPWDVMSAQTEYATVDPVRGPLGKHTNTFHKSKLGWIDETQVLSITNPMQVSLTLDATVFAETSNYRMVTIPEHASRDYYTIETRKRIGLYDGHLPGDAVIIHKVESVGPAIYNAAVSWVVDEDMPPATFSDNEGTMFRVGETFTSPSGDFTVRVDAETPEGFRITVDTRSLAFDVPCSQSDIVLMTQADVDSFEQDYGPCDTVEGSLTIGAPLPEVSNIVSLQGLAGLNAVYEDLTIMSTGSLTNLDGLDNLLSAYSLKMIYNSSLERVDALQKLASLNWLEIYNNDSLTNLNGLQTIEGIQGWVSITYNPMLSDCSALERLFDWEDDFQPGPGPYQDQGNPDVGGSILLANNQPGCNSVLEVLQIPQVALEMTGSWYDPYQSGAGFMFHAVTEELAVGYFYGYDDSGERFWLLGVHQGPMNWSETIEFTAVQTIGGSFSNYRPQDVEEREWGNILLWVHPNNNASVSVEGVFPGDTAIQGLVMSLEPLAEVAGRACCGSADTESTNAVTGSWYDPEQSGQGLALHKIDDDSGVVYFYGFDNQSNPLWLIGVWNQQWGYGEEFSVTLLQVSGGVFGPFDPNNIVEEEWGTVTLKFDDCYSGIAHFSGEDGEQFLNISLLAGSYGLDCEGL